MGEDVNWLHGERIECPQCHQPLYRVDHSPFYDEDFLYCDQCPIHVEVSRYDPAYDQVVRTLPPGHDYATRMRAIEARLKPCSCGGAFRYDAPRRCPVCHAPVIVHDPTGIDLSLWSDLVLPDAPDPTDEELEKEEQRLAPYIRADDLWRDE
jgi:hypothetical protein